MKPHGVCMKTSLSYLIVLMIGFSFIVASQPAQAQEAAQTAAPPASETQSLMQPDAATEKPATATAPTPNLLDSAPATITESTDGSTVPPGGISSYLEKRSTTSPPVAPGDSVSDPAMDESHPSMVEGEQTVLDLGDVGFTDPNANKKTAEEVEQDMREKAFKKTVDQLLPMRPGEIRRLLELYDETAQASETPVYPDPEPLSSFTSASLDPGAKPVVVKTAVGNVTTLSIVDLTGRPWPIQDLTWAGPFQIEQPESGSHMLRITPTTQFASGNISMRLVGLNPPVIFSLKSERKAIHVRLDVQIPEIGPKGVMPPVDTPIGTKAGDSFMTAVLLGVVKTGKNVDKLSVEGVDGRTSAYSRGDTVYVRTPYTMLSPAWSQSVQSADGTKVYAFNYTPVVLLSDKGKMVRAYISHKEQSDVEY